jgi:2-methylcitrate dehydratase
VQGAVLDSGAAIRALDFNDFYWGPGIGGHPSDLFAVAFAVGEAADASVARLIDAVVVGYEVYIRLLDLLAADGAFDHTTANRLGAAALAGRLIGLDGEQMTHALGLAAIHGPTLAAIRYGAISEAKAVLPAAAAMAGVVAAQLAAAGMDSPVAAVEGPMGLVAIVARGADLASLGAAAGFGTRLPDVTIKRFPCIGTAQAAVGVAVELHRQAAALGVPIERVEMRLADNVIVRHQTTDAYRAPANRETADHSFFSLLAMALVDGDLTPVHFERRRFLDDDVRAMSERLFFRCDLPGAEQGVFAARASATTRGGANIDAALDHPPGHHRNPLDTDALAAKFRGCAQSSLGASASDRIIEACLDARMNLGVRDLVRSLF